MPGILERITTRKGAHRTKSAAEIVVRPAAPESPAPQTSDTHVVETPLDLGPLSVIALGGEKPAVNPARTGAPPSPDTTSPNQATPVDEPTGLPRWLSAPTPRGGAVAALVARAHTCLIEHNGGAQLTPGDSTQIRAAVESCARELTREMRLKPEDMTAAVAELSEFISGYGPLTPLFHDEAVTDIWVDSPEAIRCRRLGDVIQTPFRFRSTAMFRWFVDRLRHSAGVTASEPPRFETFRVPDGWRIRVSLIHPPPTEVRPPSLALRIPRVRHATLYELARSNTLPVRAAAWLESQAHAGTHHVLVVGAPGSGRTTLTTTLLAAVGSHERIALIEDVPEIDPPAAHIERFLTHDTSARACVDIAGRHAANRLGFGDIGADSGEAFGVAQRYGWRGIVGALTARDAPTALTFLHHHGVAPTTPTIFITLTNHAGRPMVEAIDLLVAPPGSAQPLGRLLTALPGSSGERRWELDGLDAHTRRVPSRDLPPRSSPTLPSEESVEERWLKS